MIPDHAPVHFEKSLAKIVGRNILRLKVSENGVSCQIRDNNPKDYVWTVLSAIEK